MTYSKSVIRYITSIWQFCVVCLLLLSPLNADAQMPPEPPPPLDSFIPGQILCDRHQLDGYSEPTGTGACYMIYFDPASNPYDPNTTMYKKYIGQPATLGAYLKIGPESFPAYPYGAGVLHSGYYPTYALGLNAPCGTIVGDKSTGEIYISQPYDEYGDQGDDPTTFAYSDTYLFKVPAINTDSLRAYIKPERIIWVPKVVSEVPNLVNDGFSLPSCTIVKQSGTNSFYRLTGYVDEGGRHNVRKQYITNTDTLNMWLAWTNYYIDADISFYPSTRNAPLPPGLLVGARDSSTIYFTDDLGNKVLIPSMDRIAYLGYGLASYHYDLTTGQYSSTKTYWFNSNLVLKVNQGALDNTPSNNYL